MLELLLLRHAKSDWGDPALPDHDRDLAPRGLRAASRMGRLLRERGLVPDAALCSTAVRARRTWELASAELGARGGAEVPTRHLRTLYLAPPSRLLDAVRHREAGAARRLLLVGHNPGLHALAQRLAGSGDPALLALLREKFPTAALARIVFPTDDWADALGRPGGLAGYWRPRDLDRGEP